MSSVADEDSRLGDAISSEEAAERMEDVRRRAEELDRRGRAISVGEADGGPSPHGACIFLKLRRRVGLDYGVEIPVTVSEMDEVHREIRHRGAAGEEYLKAWIGEKVHGVLGDLGDEGSAGIFSRFEMRTDGIGDGYEVLGFVPRSALEDRPIVPSGSDMFDAVKYAASRLVHKTTRGRMGMPDEVSFWRGLYDDELGRNRQLQGEIASLKELPENRAIEELAEALEQADETAGTLRAQLAREQNRYDAVLEDNVWLSKKLADVDPLYRERVERRRRGGDR